jgi:hypothetical protein
MVGLSFPSEYRPSLPVCDDDPPPLAAALAGDPCAFGLFKGILRLLAWAAMASCKRCRSSRVSFVSIATSSATCKFRGKARQKKEKNTNCQGKRFSSLFTNLENREITKRKDKRRRSPVCGTISDNLDGKPPNAPVVCTLKPQTLNYSGYSSQHVYWHPEP